MKRKALKAAFPYTLPVLTGYGFLGLAYGVIMKVSGFSFLYPMLISITVFGGSLQFVLVTLLMSAFAPVQTFVMALMIQARHIFYGIAMLEKYKGLGWKRLPLIFGLTDETFSVNCSVDIPEDVDRGWFYLWVTLLDYSYWVTASTLGGLLGSLLTFNLEGLDFVMTAMFVVIFIEQWKKEKQHISAWIGLGSSLICLLIFGRDSFLIPTMCCILAGLTLLREPISRKGEYPE